MEQPYDRWNNWSFSKCANSDLRELWDKVLREVSGTQKTGGHGSGKGDVGRGEDMSS